MLTVKALNPIYNSGLIVGYTLKDETGKEMNVKSEAIIDAIRKNAINIINLKITENNKLVMLEEQKESSIKENNKHTVTQSKADKNDIQNDYENKDLDKIGRMHYLVKVLNEARKVYEQGTDELMSNYDYDRLYDELEALEHELGTVLSNSPTINVGYEVVSNLPKEKHDKAMLSLAKTDRKSVV